MFEGLKETWHDLKEGEPGRRFVDHFERRQERGTSTWKRVLFIALGIALIFAGIFMLIAPGPGILGVFLGGGLIAQESRTGARVMDWLEKQVRKVGEPAKRAWDRASQPVRVVLVAVSLLAAAGAAYGMYVLVS